MNRARRSTTRYNVGEEDTSLLRVGPLPRLLSVARGRRAQTVIRLRRMRADHLEWAAAALGMLGADFQVVSPPELVDLIRDWSARFSRSSSA